MPYSTSSSEAQAKTLQGGGGKPRNRTTNSKVMNHVGGRRGVIIRPRPFSERLVARAGNCTRMELQLGTMGFHHNVIAVSL